MRKALYIITIALLSLSTAHAQSEGYEKKEGLIYKDAQLFSGTYKLKGHEGKIVSVFEIAEGLEDGKVTHYYSETKIKEVGFYSKGKKTNKWEKWDVDGNKIGEAYYLNGIKTGVWIVWDHQGTKRNQMEYKDGKRSGTWKMWDEAGKLVQEKEY